MEVFKIPVTFYPESRNLEDRNIDNVSEHGIYEVADFTNSLNDLTLETYQSNSDSHENTVNTEDNVTPVIQNNVLPKTKSRILYHNLIQTHGKSTSTIKSCFNLNDISQDKHISVNFNNIK